MNAIEVRKASKRFRLPHERHASLIDRAVHGFRPLPAEELWAVEDVTLAIPEGAFAGVIGVNGSGKSTLLKLMAGLLEPDRGSVHVHGKLVPLLELGLGFHKDLTAAENVALYGAVLGYPRDAMAARIDAVIAFAELERFRDTKLKNLSSGMVVRLAFATALQADGDILLLDEIMAVGDAAFQRKCIATFEDLKRRGKTIVLVTHDLAAVTRFCDVAFWLEGGHLMASGETPIVVGSYLGFTQRVGLAEHGGNGATAAWSRWGDGRVRVTSGRLEALDGTPVATVHAGSRAVLHVELQAAGTSAEPTIAVMVRVGGALVYHMNTCFVGLTPGALHPGDGLDVRIPFDVALADGYYAISVVIGDKSDGQFSDWVNDFVTFRVVGSGCLEGVADLAAGIEWSRFAPPATGGTAS